VRFINAGVEFDVGAFESLGTFGFRGLLDLPRDGSSCSAHCRAILRQTRRSVFETAQPLSPGVVMNDGRY